ncbi:MAG TPA: DUF2461 domain-containing protein [Longimicrobium sp.]|nr:DUF2461 domain-containing protein [Longimicrobium sp.]
MDFPRLTAYLAALAENNEKAWFEAHRAEYQALRDDFTALVGDVIARISEFDDRIRWLDPASCLFRIHRDVRFSRGKQPYKTTFAASISEGGRRAEGPGYYFEVTEKGEMWLGGGVYMPEPARLERIRRHIADHPEKLRKVLRKKGFKETFGEMWGERLKRPPRGYAEDTPMIDVIKQKSFVLARERDVGTETGDVLPWMADSFRAMYPFLTWLREAQEYTGDASDWRRG